MTDGERAEAPVAERRKWFFWGCITVLVLVGIVVGAVGYFAYQLYQFTSPEPVAVPVYEPRAGQAEEVERRIERFRESLEAAAPAKPAPDAPEAPVPKPPGASLEMTSDDLNALVAGTKDGERYEGKVFFRVEGDRAHADVSLPLSELKPLGLDALKGRYLNGTITLKVVSPKDGGRPMVVVDSVVAGGKTVPEAYVSHLREKSVLDALPEGDLKRWADRISGVAIRDGKIVLER